MIRLFLLLTAISLGCAGVRPWVPAAPATEPELTLVWLGRGEVERFVEGRWVRAPAFDYDFSVEQRRFASRWESVKSLRRRHPAYDGSAGPRLETWFFQLELGAAARESVPLRVASSLGGGEGSTDRQFRRAGLELLAPVPAAAPFDRYRITQEYRYEDGVLDEVVALDEGAAPWVRSREHATLFSASRFPAAPTTR